MTHVKSDGYAHVRLTVTDIARSKAFYDDVFGWPVAADYSARVNEPGIKESAADAYGGVIYLMPNGTLLGLRPVAPDGQKFDADHTGLDHISFKVDSRHELESALKKFEEAGIEHGQINEIGSGMVILSFTDPDGVNCELTAPV